MRMTWYPPSKTDGFTLVSLKQKLNSQFSLITSGSRLKYIALAQLYLFLLLITNNLLGTAERELAIVIKI